MTTHRMKLWIAILISAAAFPLASRAEEVDESANNPRSQFRLHVRTTDPLPPAKERVGFELPKGFQISLVASEPDIAKPMNLAFDWRGRLWVSSSTEYPFPANEGKGRDTIKIIEDRDGDGTFESITTFANNLNIPIGLYPYGDGVICFSIPNILYLRDTDGDGVEDQRETLYGPFDTSRDTHGMCNGFTRGFDGWLYACHGFNNQSSVSGADGHQVVMKSGNTFRMRLDGSRIEHFTHGQVNPFGMAVDPIGDFYTADCHTKPITLLMPGGCYPSFGKPHDGLGFVPDVMEHLHGSTAIGGLALCYSHMFPTEFQGNSFGGNVLTSRVNRNEIKIAGATVQVQIKDDFLRSTDPWFRPVDLQFGPDGALYVADFYNRIIGHYEVPLTHPGRDRARGRIWKIEYVDGRSNERHHDSVRLNTIRDCIDGLAHPSLDRRMICLNRLVDQFGGEAVAPLRSALADCTLAQQRVAILWGLARVDALTVGDLNASIEYSDAVVRIHAMRILSEVSIPEDDVERLLARGLIDRDPNVQRAAAMSSGRVSSTRVAAELFRSLMRVPEDGVHLRHALRMALRDQLVRRDIFAKFADSPRFK